MAKKTYKNKTEAAKANEPKADYGKWEIHFFKSFEEMDEHDAKELAAFSPIQHLQNTTDLIKRVFNKELKKKFSDYTIHLKKNKNTAS